jgi:hypothetical protein
VPSVSFDLDRVVATPGSLAALAAVGETPLPYITRHAVGDWGDLDDDDRRMNDLAAKLDERILSAYTLTDGTRIYVITLMLTVYTPVTCRTSGFFRGKPNSRVTSGHLRHNQRQGFGG